MNLRRLTARRAMSVLYVPVIAIGGGTTIVWLAPDRPWLIPVAVIAVVVATFIAERWAPFAVTWNRRRGLNVDVVHAVVNESLTLFGVLTVPLLSAGVPGLGVWPETAPFPLQVMAAAFVLDAGVTVAHWWSHRWSMLWRFHSVHHGSQRLYGLNGLMKHPVHLFVETAVGMTPLIILGIDETVAAAVAGLVAVQLVVQHANVDYRVGRLARWMAWNAGHRLHHIADDVEGNVNFGLFTLVWDRLLGTYRRPLTRNVVPDVGLAGGSQMPASYTGQLLVPWR